MKTSITLIVGMVFFAIGVLAGPAVSAQDKGRATMTLDGGKSGVVDFNHHHHQDLIQDCQVCHKDFKKEKGSLEAAKAAGILKKKQVMNKTCVACHRAKKKAGEASGPVSCKACHKK
jgi:uncharacterized membrane protein